MLNIPITYELFCNSPKEGMIKGLWKNHSHESMVCTPSRPSSQLPERQNQRSYSRASLLETLLLSCPGGDEATRESLTLFLKAKAIPVKKKQSFPRPVSPPLDERRDVPG